MINLNQSHQQTLEEIFGDGFGEYCIARTSEEWEQHRLDAQKLIDHELSRGYNSREREAIRSDYAGYEQWK